MSTNIHNQTILGKFSELMFARQPRLATAERHQSLRASFNNWRARRAAKAELSRLSDRELADIGVTRQDIADVVNHGK
jgi:uncharacterized protein YjiS (DUF1127 family)